MIKGLSSHHADNSEYQKTIIENTVVCNTNVVYVVRYCNKSLEMSQGGVMIFHQNAGNICPCDLCSGLSHHRKSRILKTTLQIVLVCYRCSSLHITNTWHNHHIVDITDDKQLLTKLIILLLTIIIINNW